MTHCTVGFGNNKPSVCFKIQWRMGQTDRFNKNRVEFIDFNEVLTCQTFAIITGQNIEYSCQWCKIILQHGIVACLMRGINGK